MKWLERLGKDKRGSRPRCVLLTEGSPAEVAERLTRLVCRPEVKVSTEDRWLPNGTSDVREVQLDKKSAVELLPKPIRKKLSEWWLVERRNRSRTPVWDIASTCTISGQKGLLLIEAKAHSKEIQEEDKCSAKYSNRKQIEEALEESNQGLKELSDGAWRLSAESHYQVSNRFAWSWKIATFDIPVVLIYLGFLNATEMKEKGSPLRSHDHWWDILYDYSNGVVDVDYWEKMLDVGDTPLLPLVRSKSQPFDPQ